MTIIAEPGLFVRLPVQSGRFAQSEAEALDAATREAATKADLSALGAELRGELVELRAEVRVDIAQLRAEMRNGDALLAQQVAAQTDRILLRLGGLMIALIGLPFAALRLT